jgi:hypothetical protein
MFPWISKSPENPYQPELKNHFHGFSINSPRSVAVSYINADEIRVTLKEIPQQVERHNFE